MTLLGEGAAQLLACRQPAEVHPVFEAGLAAARSANETERIASFLALLGLAAQREGRLEDARTFFVDGARVLAMAGLGNSPLAGMLYGFLGALEAARGNVSQAAANLDAARVRVNGIEPLRRAVEVMSGFLEMAMAARFPGGDPADVHRAAAEERIRRAGAEADDVAADANVRLAACMLRDALGSPSGADTGTG